MLLILYLYRKTITMGNIPNFKSLPQLLKFFEKEETCIKYYEQLRWGGKPICPHCKSEKPYVTNRGYKCSNKECLKKFTVKIGTIFENSKIPFTTWFPALYLCAGHKKGISSVQLSIDLNITQKTAWFMLQRIREMLKNQAIGSFSGNTPVEVDETFVGGKEENRHTKKKQSKTNLDLANDGTVYNKKKVVIGIIERGGKIVLKSIPNTKSETMMPIIFEYVPAGSHVMTDEHSSYSHLKQVYTHDTVTHSARIYVDGNKHTNSIENFFSILKRGLMGVYHSVSDKHLERYLNEFATRFNARHTSPFENFNVYLTKSEGGLLYKNLIAD